LLQLLYCFHYWPLLLPHWLILLLSQGKGHVCCCWPCAGHTCWVSTQAIGQLPLLAVAAGQAQAARGYSWHVTNGYAIIQLPQLIINKILRTHITVHHHHHHYHVRPPRYVISHFQTRIAWLPYSYHATLLCHHHRTHCMGCTRIATRCRRHHHHFSHHHQEHIIMAGSRCITRISSLRLLHQRHVIIIICILKNIFHTGH